MLSSVALQAVREPVSFRRSLCETVIVYFRSDKRDDHMEIYLDRETGNFITAIYTPGSTSK
jgi:hypothetical protein